MINAMKKIKTKYVMDAKRGTGGIAVLYSVLENCCLIVVLRSGSGWIRGIGIMIGMLRIFLLGYIKLLHLILFQDISEGKYFFFIY